MKVPVLITAALIIATVAMTVAGQLILKTQVGAIPLPADLAGLPAFVRAVVMNAYVWLVVVFAVLSMACWIGALARLPLNVAYPFTSVSYVVVLLLSVAVLGESPRPATWVGTLLIAAGVVTVGLGNRTVGASAPAPGPAAVESAR